MDTDGNHEHDWHSPEGGGIVIDTYPEQHPYVCNCGAFTHDVETEAPCAICAPLDYQARSMDLVTLSGGPFDGSVIVRPVNRSVWLRKDPPDKRVQMMVKYEQSEDRDVWTFYCNDWTLPLEVRGVAARV